MSSLSRECTCKLQISTILDIPANVDPDQLFQLCVDQPHLLDQFKAVIASGDVIRVRVALMKRFLKLPSFLRKSSSSVRETIPNNSSVTKAASPVKAPTLWNETEIERLVFRCIPDDIIDLCDKTPHVLNRIRSVHSDFALAITDKNVAKIRSLQIQMQLRDSKRKYDERVSILNNEAQQKRIEKKIRLENIEENRNYAMENFPEGYVGISMLYIHAELNSVPIKAFVDSGTQSTVMSVSFAERCNLMRLVDTRYAGEVRGVGSAKMVGKIHIAQMKCGERFFPITISVLDTGGLDFLLGLDILRRYRAKIDLYRNLLVFHIDDRVEEVPLLGEADIPKKEGADEASSFSECECMKSILAQGFNGVPIINFKDIVKRELNDDCKKARERSAYQIFYSKVHPKIKADNPYITLGEMENLVKLMWDTLSDTEKASSDNFTIQ